MNTHHQSNQQQQQHQRSRSTSQCQQQSMGLEKQPSWRSNTPAPIANHRGNSLVKQGSALSVSKKPSFNKQRSAHSFSKYPSQLSDTESTGSLSKTPSFTTKKLSRTNSRKSQLSHQTSSRSLPEEQGTRLAAETKLWAPQVTAEGTFNFMKETVVRRSGNMYTMDLQLKQKTQPLFVGEKNGQSYIFRSVLSNIAKESVVMGTLTVSTAVKSKRTFSGVYSQTTVDYVLTHHDRSRPPCKLATIQYDKPSLYEAIKSHRQPPNIVLDLIDHVAFESKQAQRVEGGGYALDFRGRAREPSRKNVQLQNEHGKVILQMARWSKDEFHVDYHEPLDAFHAFGFALAQFEEC